MQSSPSRLTYQTETSKSDFECQFDQPSDDSGCPSEASESAESRPPSPEPIVAPRPPTPPPAVVKEAIPEAKPAPKKVIAPSVVPSKTGRNALIEERMKRRTSFVKPVTKAKPVEPEIKYTRVCEAPSFSDCEDEPVIVKEAIKVEPVNIEPTKAVQPKPPASIDTSTNKTTAEPISKTDVAPSSITIAKITLPNMSNEIGQHSELTLNQ